MNSKVVCEIELKDNGSLEKENEEFYEGLCLKLYNNMKYASPYSRQFK